MSRFSISKRKIAVIFLFVVVVTIEWFSYQLCALSWTDLTSFPKDKSVRILLVSDAQILGYKYEPPLIGYITRWDADRYVSKTFSLARRHVDPDVIVFLGDNMDEGSQADDKHFEEYSQRFYKIFQRGGVKSLFVPGDNDIGGEGPDIVTDEKISRFRRRFHENQKVHHQFLRFVRVNYFTGTIEKFDNVTKHKKILISHFPLIPAFRSFGKRVIIETRPDLIFSGHEHRSNHFVGNRSTGEFIEVEKLAARGYLWKFDLNSEYLHEIMIPTCSYRMGMADMGYGAAIIEQDGTLHYTVLWLPRRYAQFTCYLIALVIVCLFLAWNPVSSLFNPKFAALNCLSLNGKK